MTRKAAMNQLFNLIQDEYDIKWLTIMGAIYFIRLGLNIVNSLASAYSST